MSIKDFVIVFAVVLIIFTAPAIPGILLLFYLNPHTFWEKLAWFLVSFITYMLLLFLIMPKIYENL